MTETAASEAKAARAWRAAAAVLYLSALAILYAPVLGNFFVGNDLDWLEYARRVGIERIIYPELWFDRVHVFRPLQSLFFWCGYRVFGLHPAGYYAVNLLIVLATAWALRAVVCDLLDSESAGLAAGLLFLTAPAGVEGRIGLGEQSAIWVSLFSLLTLLAWSRGRWGWSLVALFLAICGHEAAMVMPVVLLVYELLWRRREERRWEALIAAVGVSAAFAGFQLGLQQSTAIVQSGDLSVGPHVFPMFATHLRSLLGAAFGHADVGLVLIAAIVAARWRDRAPVLGVVWIVVGLLPFSFFWDRPGGYVHTVSRYLSLGVLGLAFVLATLFRRPNWLGGLLLTAVIVWGALGVQAAVGEYLHRGQLYHHWVFVEPPSRYDRSVESGRILFDQPGRERLRPRPGGLP